jgi:hypothetical protein
MEQISAPHQAAPEGARPVALLKPDQVIKLDRTRRRRIYNAEGKSSLIDDWSECHGDRLPDDPHYHVHFFQDGLPFDAEGKLVPDDGKEGGWKGVGADGKPIDYRPLYTQAMRMKVMKKMTKHANGLQVSAPADDDLNEDVETREAASDEINLKSWLMGEIDVPFYMIVIAIKKRCSTAVASIPEAVRFLVMEEAVCGKNQLRPDFARHLEN